MTYRLYVLKQALLNGLRSISDWALFVGVILIGGIGSHWYMVEAGSGLSVERDGAWVAWSNAGRNDNDPYARAHFARLGVLPPSSDIARTYIAREDSEGTKLHSSCDYAIESGDFKSRWWSITVFDSDGALVRNAAGRHAYSRDTVAMGNDGNFVVTLSRDARPELLNGVTVIEVQQATGDLTLIPYYAWAHRGIGEMAVWLQRDSG